MTLLIAVGTGDGLILAGDSRTTLSPPDQRWRVLSDFTHKVFQVDRFAVATSGWAFLQGRNIAAHMAEFVQEFTGQGKSPEDLSNELADFFGKRLNEHISSGMDEAPAADAVVISLVVHGYNEGQGECWEVTFPSGAAVRHFTTESGGAIWRGQTDVVTRLIKGFDPTLGQRVSNDTALTYALQSLQPSMEGMEYVINLRFMNLQDAIDLAVLLIRTTIDVQRLTNGLVSEPGSFPGVGGPIEIALVTPDGFSWIQRAALLGERPSGRAEDL